MSQEIDRVGTFRGRIVDSALHEGQSPSKSLGVNLRIAIDQSYNFETQQWEDWQPFDYECYGYVNLAKSDGSANDKSAENFCKCTGWNGSLADIATGDWSPTPIQLTTKAETYKERTSYKLEYLNEYDRVPGGGGLKGLDADAAKSLQSKYGATFKALAANVKRNQPPKDKPKAPPAAVASGDVSFDKF